MKFFYSVLVLITFAAFTLKAQNFAPSFQINLDTAVYVDVPNTNIQFLPINIGGLSFQQVSQPAYGLQFRNLGSVKGQIPVSNTLWLRYQIKNNIDRPVDITLPMRLARADVYIRCDTGKWEHCVTGLTVPISERQGLKDMMDVTCTVAAGKTITVYENDKFSTPSNAIYVSVGFKNNVIRKYYLDQQRYRANDMFDTFSAGFMMSLFLINIFFFSIVRERIYLLYSFSLLLIANMFSALPLYYWFDGSQVFVSITLFLNAIFIFYLYFTVVSLQLQIKKHHPVWHKIIKSSNNAYIVIGTISILYFQKSQPTHLKNIFNEICIGLRGFILVCFIVVIVIDLVRKRRQARLFMMASLPFLILEIMVAAIKNFRATEAVGRLEEITIIWGAVVMSWSLFDRFRLVFNENARQGMLRERLAKEKEIERNELIAKQKLSWKLRYMSARQN